MSLPPDECLKLGRFVTCRDPEASWPLRSFRLPTGCLIPTFSSGPSRLTELVIQRNSRQEKAGSRSTAAPIEFAVERHDGGALLIRTADELMLTV